MHWSKDIIPALAVWAVVFSADARSAEIIGPDSAPAGSPVLLTVAGADPDLTALSYRPRPAGSMLRRLWTPDGSLAFMFWSSEPGAYWFGGGVTVAPDRPPDMISHDLQYGNGPAPEPVPEPEPKPKPEPEPEPEPDVNPYPPPPEKWKATVGAALEQFRMPANHAWAIADMYARAADGVLAGSVRSTADLRSFFVAEGTEIGSTGKYPEIRVAVDRLFDEVWGAGRPIRPLGPEWSEFLQSVAWYFWEMGEP